MAREGFLRLAVPFEEQRKPDLAVAFRPGAPDTPAPGGVLAGMPLGTPCSQPGLRGMMRVGSFHIKEISGGKKIFHGQQ